VPSGLNATDCTTPKCPVIGWIMGCSVASHSRIVWSRLPDAITLPSGEYATLVTSPVCPVRLAVQAPVAGSHRRSVRSQLPDTIARDDYGFVPTDADEGYGSVGTIVETNTDDSPFLVDSVSEELAARELRVRLLVHPVVGTVRDERGRIERVLSGRDASHRESVMHYELERRLGKAERTDLERKIGAILHDVHLVVRDFEPMQERTRPAALTADGMAPITLADVKPALAAPTRCVT